MPQPFGELRTATLLPLVDLQDRLENGVRATRLFEVISEIETENDRSASRRALNTVLRGLNRLRGS